MKLNCVSNLLSIVGPHLAHLWLYFAARCYCKRIQFNASVSLILAGRTCATMKEVEDKKSYRLLQYRYATKCSVIRVYPGLTVLYHFTIIFVPLQRDIHGNSQLSKQLGKHYQFICFDQVRSTHRASCCWSVFKYKNRMRFVVVVVSARRIPFCILLTFYMFPCIT